MPTWVRVVAVLVAAAVVLAAAGLVVLDRFARSRAQDLDALPERRVIRAGQTLRVAVADSPATVGPGLSGQPGLARDRALLLVAPDGDTRVTMLGMRFALDVVWLDAEGTILQVRRGVPARPWPLSYAGPSAASSVLELGTGGAERYALTAGSRLDLRS